MKIKNEFILRNIAGENIVVPIGTTTQNFNGIISLNDVATFIWKKVDEVNTVDELVNLVIEEYDIDIEVAKADVEEFIENLKRVDMIEE